jgi:hypothetical protein
VFSSFLDGRFLKRTGIIMVVFILPSQEKKSGSSRYSYCPMNKRYQ